MSEMDWKNSKKIKKDHGIDWGIEERNSKGKHELEKFEHKLPSSHYLHRTGK